MNLVQVQHPKWWRGALTHDIFGGVGGRTSPVNTRDGISQPINTANDVTGRTRNTTRTDWQR